jgi:hypothetical protein
MKNLVLLLIATTFGFFGFSQEFASITKDQLKNGKSTGVYEFKLPESIDQAKVDAVKGYYKDYFTVNFDEATDVLKVNLLKNEEVNITVMNRILVALDLRTIKVDGKEMTFQDMKDAYLK